MGEPIRIGGGNVNVLQEVDALAAIGPRRAGSEAERRTARQLEKRLAELGRDVRVEPTRVRPAFALTHLIHATAGIVASVLSVYVPSAGLALALLTTISAFGDLTGAFPLVRALMPVRASQNVVSDEGGDKPGLIVLAAHYDAPLTGMLQGRRAASLWARALFWSLVVITVCAAGRLLGLDATWFTVLQFIPTVVLIATTPLFADAAIAETSKAAHDNAAGVATVLRLAQSHGERLEHFDLMVVFTGASAHFGLGMRDWLKRHRSELDPEATAVISVDNLPNGAPAYAVKEGPVLPSRMHPTLLQLAEESEEAIAYSSRELSDAYLARASGLPTLRVSAAGAEADDVDGDALERAYGFTATLLERIDEEIGPRLR